MIQRYDVSRVSVFAARNNTVLRDAVLRSAVLRGDVLGSAVVRGIVLRGRMGLEI